MFAIENMSPGRRLKKKTSGREGHVLFMDGEEMIRDVAGEILKRKGYEVELARDNTSSFQLRIIVNRRCP
jgi:hypothetical protein